MFGHYRILLKTKISKTSQYEPNAIAARKLNACEHVTLATNFTLEAQLIEFISTVWIKGSIYTIQNSFLKIKEAWISEKIRLQYSIVVKVFKIKSSCLQWIPAYLRKLKKHMTNWLKWVSEQKKKIHEKCGGITPKYRLFFKMQNCCHFIMVRPI